MINDVEDKVINTRSRQNLSKHYQLMGDMIGLKPFEAALEIPHRVY